ncbi:MAG TPA: hypothetical protein VFD16_01970 [Candidatus Saccharimonadales bacterium]|nr:hypothetical protein [Candidatus Saccharimonadales bacterium]
MKKLIIFSLIAVMAFSFVALSPILAEDNQETNALTSTTAVRPESNDIKARQLMSGLEKILTPEQIKNFTNVVRQGNSLYGVRKIASSTPTESQGVIKQLEKIAAPWLIQQYEQIRKVGTALWGLKKDDGEKASQGQAKNIEEKIPVNVFVKPGSAACVISAIETKDAAVVANNLNKITLLNSAINARTTCQTTAINASISSTSTSTSNISLQRNEFNLCLKAFEQTSTQIKKDFEAEHKTLWTTYRDSLKICQPSTSSSEGELEIEDGGDNPL